MAAAIPGLSLPGLVHASASSTPVPNAAISAPSVRTEDLPARSEFRFEVSFHQTVRIKLLSGTAELFGTELAPSASLSYTFSGTKAAIYTWHGCKLEIEGECESDYVAEETKMMEAANLHFALENLRAKATQAQQRGGATEDMGPRVLIVGPENAGKTSLAKILTAYAVKMGRQPMVVNLDPRQGILSMPGSFTAAAFAHILDVEEGWGSSPISGPSSVPVKMPLVYHFGLQAPDAAGKVFKPLITRMALTVTSRLQEDKDVRAAGCIIDTAGVYAQGKAGTYDSILHIISEFSVNVVIVLGSERLYSDLSRRFSKTSDEPISIIKLDKSGGCVDRDEAWMKQLRANQIRSYFFGSKAIPLNPHTHWEDFSAVSIYRIIEADETTNTSFLPGNDYYEDSGSVGGQLKIYEKIQPSMSIQNSILAITNAGPNDSQQNIRDSSVLCYVYVSEVDEVKKRIRLLAPTSGRIPSRAILMGRWPEDVVDLVG